MAEVGLTRRARILFHSASTIFKSVSQVMCIKFVREGTHSRDLFLRSDVNLEMNKGECCETRSLLKFGGYVAVVIVRRVGIIDNRS